MPENLSKLNQKQLKARKILAKRFKKELEGEIKQIDRYTNRIDGKLTTNPKIPDFKLDKLNVSQLTERQCLYNRILMRIKGLEMSYLTELKKIDKLILEKR